MRHTLIIIAGLLALGSPLAAQQVATLVAIPIPPQMPKAQLVAAFEQSQPQYRAIPGLIRKYYTVGDDGKAGGIYLWTSRAAAEAWFTDAWAAAVLKRWGKPADVRYFEVPIVLDGTNAQAGRK